MTSTEYHHNRQQADFARKQIYACNRCSLGKTANRVPFDGVTWMPKLLLLGEAPGANENNERKPFVGPAGKLLDDMLTHIGLTRNHVMIANTVCCRPQANRNPEWSEIDACKVNREAQIMVANTWVGVTLGKIALNALIDDDQPIGAWKGKPFWHRNKVWVPTYHPAYGLRNKAAVSEIKAHLYMAMRIYAGELEAPRPTTSHWSLESDVLIVDHEDVKVPDRVRELARATFTRVEWVKLRTGQQRRAAVEVKAHLEAEVVS